MKNSYINWQKEGIKCEIKYEMEYVNDKKVWDSICKGDCGMNGKPEAWELYKKKEYDNMGEAMCAFVYYYLNDKIYDCKLWQRVYVDDEMIREDYVEPDSTFFYSLTQFVNKILSDKYYKNNNAINEKNLIIENYETFIKGMNLEDLFKQYMYEIASKH